MEIYVRLPDDRSPNTLKQVMTAIRSQKLTIKHDKKNWGDWLRIEGCETVVSIECLNGLTSAATIEHSEDDSEEVLPALYRAFDKLGWEGFDEDGPYRLI